MAKLNLESKFTWTASVFPLTCKLIAKKEEELKTNNEW